MAEVAFLRASIFTTAVEQLIVSVCLLLPFVPVSGCASRRHASPVPPEVAQTGVGERVLIPHETNVNPPETVVKPITSAPTPADPPAPPPVAVESTTFALTDVISFALQNNPRLRSARATAERAAGQEQTAFAPFLPQIDFLGQGGVTSATLAPGVPGATGFILAGAYGTRSYEESELALQWTLYDFGRTGGRYRQAVAREYIAELQIARACQTVGFDVTAAYLDVLLARASRRVQEDAVRRAQAILDDTVARRAGGVALKEEVLRAEVQLSESREALVVAREGEFDAVARLNNAMGRNAGLPLEVIDLDIEPPLTWTLPQLLEQAAGQRPEVAVAQQAVAAAQEGRQAVRAEFLPRIFVRASAGRTDGENVISGWQEGAGLHVEAPLYSGGGHRGDLRSADAEIEGALADAQAILDAISLQVNVAYRGVVAARERIDLARTAIAQAEETLRLLRVRYRNGNATPTDIVDSEAALTRSQQRYFSAAYTYLAALARLDYAIGRQQGAFTENNQATTPEVLPRPVPEVK
jgi:outer membrane protein TolC